MNENSQSEKLKDDLEYKAKMKKVYKELYSRHVMEDWISDEDVNKPAQIYNVEDQKGQNTK